MKKAFLISVLILTFTSCNFQASDSIEDLSNKYQFIEEGGSLNMVLRDNEAVIDSGAVSASFNDDYIFFSEDTSYSMEPKKVSKKLLRYYIHNIKKDTLSKPLNYKFFSEFIRKNKIDEDLDISKKEE